jgi:hypothetical protein
MVAWWQLSRKLVFCAQMVSAVEKLARCVMSDSVDHSLHLSSWVTPISLCRFCGNCGGESFLKLGFVDCCWNVLVVHLGFKFHEIVRLSSNKINLENSFTSYAKEHSRTVTSSA